MNMVPPNDPDISLGINPKSQSQMNALKLPLMIAMMKGRAHFDVKVCSNTASNASQHALIGAPV
jgi:hypothetical protein